MENSYSNSPVLFTRDAYVHTVIFVKSVQQPSVQRTSFHTHT